MNTLIIAAVLLVLLGVAYQSGWSKGRGLSTANGVVVHSRPQYHGSYVAIWAMLPALAILALWGLFGGNIVHDFTVAQIPQDTLLALDQNGLNLTIGRIQALASGYGVVGEVQPWEQAAGDALRSFQFLTFAGVLAAAIVAGGGALYYARSRITARHRSL